eukprot:scaffold5463_cov155-Skeletonema_marinoi.AAC.7
MSQYMRIVGNKIVRIGWRHFTEGKLPNALKHMQRQHLLSHHKYLTIDVWMKGFIDQLLTLTHTQWLCRNLTKHHKTMGTKALTAREEIQKEVEELLRMGFSELPPDSRCLLEIAPVGRSVAAGEMTILSLKDVPNHNMPCLRVNDAAAKDAPIKPSKYE